ncbi:hypothetical protein LDO26_15410 [Luteimonas sp. BDR2-5]|uniref:hypothetical protein n=1 Tax=Proluteimonas luteida TaxID=2878685 RepID=UPI001E361565|nr:hypothetical protein [Luteimonas sp. BDR2-5]MCD9029581.1 hypothetical protein [Luteimonas sp. BDR2-5]
MPHFKVILSGRGIDLPFEGDSAIGFFTTRQVRATDLPDAESLAKELVLAEWRSGGTYAQANRGSLPVLAVEHSFSVGWVAGTFGRNPSGYTFYCHED